MSKSYEITHVTTFDGPPESFKAIWPNRLDEFAKLFPPGAPFTLHVPGEVVFGGAIGAKIIEDE